MEWNRCSQLFQINGPLHTHITASAPAQPTTAQPPVPLFVITMSGGGNGTAPSAKRLRTDLAEILADHVKEIVGDETLVARLYSVKTVEDRNKAEIRELARFARKPSAPRGHIQAQVAPLGESGCMGPAWPCRTRAALTALVDRAMGFNCLDGHALVIRRGVPKRFYSMMRGEKDYDDPSYAKWEAAHFEGSESDELLAANMVQNECATLDEELVIPIRGAGGGQEARAAVATCVDLILALVGEVETPLR